ncbi:MAG: glycerophosphodiester phosphodiesterase [Proteobacteria bacterium]|nr:glycerophosphodiester phosphodiesterase [Pseudomonadota bacterium]
MNWPYPRIVAHRGGGKLAPENTLGAIRLGAEMGFHGVEFDVMLAGDGTPVLIHDETLDRTTGVHGRVPDMPYGRLAGLDAGSWFGRKWRGERIPTFEQAGQLCLELDLWANVEIKPARGHERETGTAVALAVRALWRGAALAPILSSFSVEALIAAKRVAPELPRGYLVGRIPNNWRETMGALGCVALHCNHRALTKPLAEEIHAAGYAILCWTVNDRRVARKLLGWGVDCLVTDALKRIDPAFGKQVLTKP